MAACFSLSLLAVQANACTHCFHLLAQQLLLMMLSTPGGRTPFCPTLSHLLFLCRIALSARAEVGLSNFLARLQHRSHWISKAGAFLFTPLPVRPICLDEKNKWRSEPTLQQTKASHSRTGAVNSIRVAYIEIEIALPYQRAATVWHISRLSVANTSTQQSSYCVEFLFALHSFDMCRSFDIIAKFFSSSLLLYYLSRREMLFFCFSNRRC